MLHVLPMGCSRRPRVLPAKGSSRSGCNQCAGDLRDIPSRDEVGAGHSVLNGSGIGLLGRQAGAHLHQVKLSPLSAEARPAAVSQK